MVKRRVKSRPWYSIKDVRRVLGSSHNDLVGGSTQFSVIQQPGAKVKVSLDGVNFR